MQRERERERERERGLLSVYTCLAAKILAQIHDQPARMLSAIFLFALCGNRSMIVPFDLVRVTAVDAINWLLS